MCNLLVFISWQINQNSLKHCLGQQCVGQSKYFLWAPTVPWGVRLGHLIYVKIHH